MDALDRQAFDLGWDYATFGLDVPDRAKGPFCDGYRAFLHGNNKKVQRADKFVRKWLQIRFNAIRRGKEFSLDITPEYLERITPASGKCPVTYLPLTFGTGKPTDWSIDRANNNRGYVRGNILIISVAANAAKGKKTLDHIRSLSSKTEAAEGLTPHQWQRMSILIEPAFGEEDGDMNPVQVLLGQPIALGMPVSPIASFQVSMARAIIAGWDTQKREAMVDYIAMIGDCVTSTKSQRKAMHRLFLEILRRSKHLPSYTEIWATKRVQKRLVAFLDTLGNPGLRRLMKLQELTIGSENVKLA